MVTYMIVWMRRHAATLASDLRASAADADDECHLVVAEYDGRPGPHPVRLDQHVWPLLPTEGDQGARALLELHPEWLCRVPCLGSGDDIDTVEDLDRWKSC